MFKKNQKTTLVLSGGAALGFAHFGALKVLEEKQIFPSEIIGTSMGAIAGAFFACGYTSKEMQEIIEEIKYLKLLKINIFSGNSLIEQAKIRKFLREKLGDILVNETKIEIKIISTNIKTGEIKIFDKTSNVKLIDAICASISIPGIFKPYQIDDEIFVDGMLCSNLPFEYATYKKIIAINIITENFVKKKKYKYVPQIIEKSYYITLLNQTKEKIKNNKNKKLKVIDINLEDFRSHDFHKYKEIIEQGKISFQKNYS